MRDEIAKLASRAQRLAGAEPLALAYADALRVLADPSAGPEWATQLAPKAEYRIRKGRLGPRARPEEASYLATVVGDVIDSETAESAGAERVLRVLRCCPRLCADCNVPVTGAPWAAEAKASAISAVRVELEKPRAHRDEKTVARAILRTLGMAEKHAKSAFKADDVASDRASRRLAKK